MVSQGGYPQQPYAMSHLSGGLYGQPGTGHGTSASAQYAAQGQSAYPQQYAAAMHQGWGSAGGADRRGAAASWDTSQ